MQNNIGHKISVWNICACATHGYYLIHTIYKVPEIVSVANLHWEFLLINGVYNLGQNICIVFHVLVQFFFTKSGTELDHYHQKVNVVVSRVSERLKTYDLRKLGNFKKIPEMLWFDGEYSAGHLKAKFWRFSGKNRKIQL